MLAFLMLVISICNGQTVLEILKDVLNKSGNSQPQKTLKTVTLVSTTKKLNGGARAMFGGAFGAASRVEVPVVLPENTVEWYYSFSTSPASTGNLQGGLLLALQLGNVISSLTPAGIATAIVNGLSQKSIQTLQIPSGSIPINAYLLDEQNVNPFLNKTQFSRFINESSERSTQGLMKINTITQGSYFIGLQNISSTSGVIITIEVVAIVAE